MIIRAGMLLAKASQFRGAMKFTSMLLGIFLLLAGTWFAYYSVMKETTNLHRFLTLTPSTADTHKPEHVYTDVTQLKQAMVSALEADPSQPIVLDFYADWCVSCKEMAAYTLNQPEVQAEVNMQRFFKADVTTNTPEHQALLKEYGLFGPPGIFVIHADGRRSAALLGFVKPDAFIRWYQDNR